VNEQNSYTITAGGQVWTIGLPHTAEDMVLKHNGREWSCQAVKAVSSKGQFLLVEYRFRMWHPERRPFDTDRFIILDSDRKPVVQTSNLNDALWSAATGRDPRELPDQSVSASGGFDDAPRPRREQRVADAQHQRNDTSRTPAAAPRQSGVSRTQGRLAKALDLFRKHGQ
jgi:hypothetical protein